MLYLFTHDKEIEAKVNERKREKAFKEIMAEHPEWVEELNVQELQEQKEEDLQQELIEARKRLRDEFERAAQEHPEWLK